METNIRHYKQADQQAIFTIAADSAFFGEAVEAFLDDRRLFSDAFTRYYVENESNWTWVAENENGVAGFLLGCGDTATQAKSWRAYIVRKILVNALSGKYKLGRKTAGFAWGMLVGQLRGEDPWVDVRRFPAHLQIDVRKGYRGEGLGRRLIEAYLDQLRAKGIPGVHLETTTHNRAACHLYESLGFKLLDQRTNHFWTRMLGIEVKNRSYGLLLNE